MLKTAQLGRDGATTEHRLASSKATSPSRPVSQTSAAHIRPIMISVHLRICFLEEHLLNIILDINLLFDFPYIVKIRNLTSRLYVENRCPVQK